MIKFSVFIADDSPAIVELARKSLESTGEYQCHCFTDGAQVLEAFEPGTVDCVLADLRMPRPDGEELYQLLEQRDPLLSFVIMTGHADVRTAVRIMERGTFTLLEKPFSLDELISTVRRASQHTREQRARRHLKDLEAARLSTLTSEEREVLDCMVAGLPNKAIATNLTLSPRTLDRRRQSLMRKLNVDSVAQVAALVARVTGESS
jgi:two-component system response regulator FixJ